MKLVERSSWSASATAETCTGLDELQRAISGCRAGPPTLVAVPWCQPCERYLAPSAVSPDGSCPSCGQGVDPGPFAGPAAPAGTAASRVPWHFWILLALAVAYLGWRAVQGVALLL